MKTKRIDIRMTEYEVRQLDKAGGTQRDVPIGID
jgi:hypothetical protein